MSAALLEKFITYLDVEKRYSLHTVQAYGRDIDSFLRFMAGHTGGTVDKKTLSSLQLNDFYAFLYHQTEEVHKQKSSANRSLSAVRSFYEWLASRQMVTNETVALVRQLKTPAPVPKAPSERQAMALVKYFLPQKRTNTDALMLWVLMLMLYGMGLRISEALSLNQRDVAGDVVTVLGKGNKQRRVPLPKPVAAAVQLLPRTAPDDPLFLGPRGRRMNARYVQLKLVEARQALDLPAHITPHAMRHAFASHLLAEGADLRVVQELLGHVSLSTTQRYLDKDVARLVRVHKNSHPLEG